MEAEVSRTRRLAAEELVSKLVLETQEAQLDAAEAAAAGAAARAEQAQAAVDESRFDLGRAVVRAPTSGRVGRRQVEVGSIADPSTPLFELGNLDDLVVEIPLTEQMLSFVRVGEPVRITPRHGGRVGAAEQGAAAGAEPATVSRISWFLERDSFTTVGESDTAGAAAGLRPGMFVTVDVLYGESEQATLVPASALWQDPRTGVQGIYVFTEPLSASAQQPVGIEPSGPPVDPSAEDFAVELRPVEVIAEGRALLGGTRGRAGRLGGGRRSAPAGRHRCYASSGARRRLGAHPRPPGAAARGPADQLPRQAAAARPRARRAAALQRRVPARHLRERRRQPATRGTGGTGGIGGIGGGRLT
jgi:RND family efflux transporter MFP subunit